MVTDEDSHTSSRELEVHEVLTDWKNEYEDLLTNMNFEECLEVILSRFKVQLHRDICEEWIYNALYSDTQSQEYYSNKYKVSQPQVSSIIRRLKTDLMAYMNGTLREGVT